MLAGEAAAEKTACIERISGEEVKDGEACLHPDHAAQEVGGRDPRLVKEADIAAGSEEDGCYGKGGGSIRDRAGKGHSKLANALIGVFLAFRVGVREEAADGQQKDSTETQTEPGGDDEAYDFAHHCGEHDDEEEAEAA